MTAGRHVCPAQGCSWTIANDLLMCSQHWALVPTHLQRDVNRYWRDIRTARDHQTKLIAEHNHGVARDAAIAHVDELLHPFTA